MSFELELPGVYVDALTLETAPADVLVVNRFPESGESDVPRSSNVSFDLVSFTSGAIGDLLTLDVYIEGVLALSVVGGVPTWHAPFNGAGSSYAASGATAAVVIDPVITFESENLVDVQVIATLTGPFSLDETWTFTCADETAPRMTLAEGTAQKSVKVTFNENMETGDGTAVTDALNPSAYTVIPTIDIDAAVTPVVSTVTEVAKNVFLLGLDIEMTPRGNYTVRAVGIADDDSNVIAAPYDIALMSGFEPAVPEGRDLQIIDLLPDINVGEDSSQDLERTVSCLQEVLDLLLYQFDSYTGRVLDPDTADEAFLDLILFDQGNPFSFPLTEAEKRRLVRVLVPIYQLKGTADGIIDAVRFFMSIEITIIAYWPTTLSLGESELGVDWILGPGGLSGYYSFEVVSPVELDDDQERQMTQIVDYMKPAHTHLVKITEPTPPAVIAHLELGESELDTEFTLY